MRIKCSHCGKVADKATGAVNRARSLNAPLYCSRKCAGLARRNPPKTDAQRKAEKAAYDREYRAKNLERIKAEKKAYYAANFDREKERAYRQQTMARHVEYCRRPEYVEWKRNYDRKYRAAKHYGAFADCFLLVMDIRDECLSQMSDYEIRYAKGGVAKTQQRRRAYDRSIREDFEGGSLGDPDFCEGREDGGFTGGRRGLPSAGNLAHDQHPTSRRAPVQAASGSGRNHVR